ncbi:MAG: M42 family metallopeptidase [Verrucomicrobiota bacterium]
MDEQEIELLRELCEAHAVSGFEDEVRDIFERELKNYGEIGFDRLGSVYCANHRKGPRILVAGHMDEVGFRVQTINAQGFLTFVPVGGWWGHHLLAQRVVVKTGSGEKIEGVITSRPPHFLAKADRSRVQDVGDMFIDVGARSGEEAKEWGIEIGDPIAPDSSFTRMKSHGRFMAKAFDNRVGMALAILIGKRLLKTTSANLVVAGTVQEEVGLRGARTLANLLEPDYALVLEGPPADDTPGFDLTVSQGVLGEGVQIRLHDPSAILDPQLASRAKELAYEAEIPHQVTVRSSGGTDAGIFHQSGNGVPSLVLGVPCRYIHSHQAILDGHDFSAALSLITGLVESL